MQNMVADAVMVEIFIFAMVVLGYAFCANKLAFTSCRGAGAFSREGRVRGALILYGFCGLCLFV